MRWLPLIALFAAAAAPAHEIRLDVAGASATVITLHYADGQPFAFEAYELYPAGSETPGQVGRTDGRGRIALLADAAGEWRLKAWSDDGHGVDRKLTALAGEPAAATAPAAETPRAALWLGGLGTIFGLFGLLQLYLGRKKR